MTGSSHGVSDQTVSAGNRGGVGILSATQIDAGHRADPGGVGPSNGADGSGHRDRQRLPQSRTDLRTCPHRPVEDVEFATLGWVHWYNTSRLHAYLGDVPPTEFEAAFYYAHVYDVQGTDQPLVDIQ